MKLRSGKIIGAKELPVVLQTKLDNNLKIFKDLLINHKEVAIEALKMIAEARNVETIYKVERILEEAGIEDEGQALGITYGSLTGLVIGQHHFYSRQNIAPIYHDEIKERILSFSEIALIGDQINQDEIGA